jgi:hypothetical protein
MEKLIWAKTYLKSLIIPEYDPHWFDAHGHDLVGPAVCRDFTTCVELLFSDFPPPKDCWWEMGLPTVTCIPLQKDNIFLLSNCYMPIGFLLINGMIKPPKKHL